MRLVPRSIEKIDDDIKSAGQSFIGIYIEDLLNRSAELDDDYKKNIIIEEIFETQHGFHDTEIGGTRTRVNSVLRIIKANQVEYVLRIIDGRNSKVSIEAVEKSQSLLKRINDGQFKLPNLE